MSDHREALEHIMHQCADSRTYTRRTQVINNIAMHALGMTSNQRHDRHMEIFARIGDEPGRTAYLARKAKRDAKQSDVSDPTKD